MKDQVVKDYILRNVERYPTNIVAQAMNAFGITRPAVLNYVRQAIAEGLLDVEGSTRDRRYRLRYILDLHFRTDLFPETESVIWQYKVYPHLKSLPQNILSICEYGFTEMMNNAIDHSESRDRALIIVRQNYAHIEFIIMDKGVGIFEKIQKACGLSSPQEALLELSKGKLTTYPQAHAGEGIFFTSRMFDEFSIRSGLLYYERIRKEDDEWLIESLDRSRYRQGTAVVMRISTNANWTQQSVFKRFQGDDLRFRRTHVPIVLAQESGQGLVSRSQAKRILSRFEQFTEVIIDFQGIETIGQGFADEIFRIFPQKHPNIPVTAVHTTPSIDEMIAYVRANAPKLP